ncbi:MAG: metal-sulfur cluster assembly factor, partial [bacterium]
MTETANTTTVTEEQVIKILKNVYDPEIPVNVVDLGLIYRIVIEEGNTPDKKRVYVEMTLTAPGCGMSGMIGAGASEAVKQLPGVEDAAVNFVWDPPWDPSKITEDGKAVLRGFGYQ